MRSRLPAELDNQRTIRAATDRAPRGGDDRIVAPSEYGSSGYWVVHTSGDLHHG